MSLQNLINLMRRIREILAVEEQAIRQSDWSRLTLLTEEKSASLSGLEAVMNLQNDPLRHDVVLEFEKLQLALKENALLLATSLNGVKAVFKRLESIREREITLGAYNKAGDPIFLSSHPSTNIKMV